MAKFAAKWWSGLRSMWMVQLSFLVALVFVSAERDLREGASRLNGTEGGAESSFLLRALDFLWQSKESDYQHVWPEMKFGWRIVVGSLIGFCGAAFGSVGGVGGGGIFVPMLVLIIGFDQKSATALSKCKDILSDFWKVQHRLEYPVSPNPEIEDARSTKSF